MYYTITTIEQLQWHMSNCQAWATHFTNLYTQQQKKRENLLLLNWLQIKYAEFKKYMFYVKLAV